VRLHHLEAVAFGPFAERVEVDFDALSDAGLFLLTGATGAGKTSVLDAVCFALYGAVPGDRQGAKRLRSDHAAPGVAPSVTLELSVAGRRFRVARSPAWERPRRRGSGTTREQARVLLTERVDGDWVARATRLDEAGHLVSELLGLTLGQFCQVQMLPQGRFQAFLRADSDERHRLLQRLFRTSRFEDVEQWLRDRRRSLRRDDVRAHEVVAGVVGRVSEAAGRPLPDGWDHHDLGGAADELGAWGQELRAGARSATRQADDDVAAAVAAEVTAREALDDARALVQRQQRRRRAEARAAVLDDTRDAHAARVAALEAARRASAVLPLWDEAARACDDAARAGHEAARTLHAARDLLDRPECTVDELDAAADEAVTAAGRARAREPHVAELTTTSAALAEAGRRRDQVATQLAELEQRAAGLPDELTRARQVETDAARAGDRVAVARQQVDAVAARLEAARGVAALVERLDEADTLHRASVDAAQDLREHWLHVQERRLEGMAAEIAGSLAVGASCPVCGSADHPHPARSGADAPDAAAERAARRAVDDAESERHARALAVHDLRTRLDVARERSGHATVPDLQREHTTASAGLADLRRHADELPDATARREALEAELSGVADRRTALTAEAATLDTRRTQLQHRCDRLTTELDELLAGTGHDSVTALADHLDAVAAGCRSAREAAAVHARATAHATRSHQRAAAAAAEAGFGDEAATRAVALPSLLLDRLEREVRDHEAAVAGVAEALADPELAAAAAVEPPDVASLTEDHAARHDALTAARAAASVAERRAQRLQRLVADLHDALAAWAPVRADLDVADRMASLADGSSPDNRLRMRLSAYVLAARLGQVVDAANERLARMFDHRYALEHTGARGVGESRGGLSLRVRDDWTGESRDPATLSGGETFVVSLALALGLADVISHEAGGSELDTLFVDEGFGSLDAETLDQVLDTLDSLRDGGRVVGVVSHVAEMQTRIPTQLHVRKRRVGSTLSQER